MEEATELLPTLKKQWRLCEPNDLEQWQKATERLRRAPSEALPSDREARKEKALTLECIQVPKNLKCATDGWKKNSDSFLDASTTTEERLLQRPVFLDFYHNAARIEENHTTNDICRQFNLYVFFEALFENGYHDGTLWCTHAQDRLIQILHPSQYTELKLRQKRHCVTLLTSGRGYSISPQFWLAMIRHNLLYPRTVHKQRETSTKTLKDTLV